MAPREQHRGERRGATALGGMSGNYLLSSAFGRKIRSQSLNAVPDACLVCFGPMREGNSSCCGVAAARGTHHSHRVMHGRFLCSHQALARGGRLQSFRRRKNRVIGEHNHTHLVWRRIGRHGLSTCWIALVFTNCMRMPHGMASWHARVEPFATLGVRRGVRAHIIALAS